MHSTLYRAALLGILLMSAALAQAAGCPKTLQVGMLNYALPPLINEARDGMVNDAPGQMVAWLREALVRSGCKVELRIQRLPVPRGYEYLRSGEIDVWTPATASEQSLEAGVLPMRGAQVDDRMGFARSRYSFYVPKGDTSVQWDGKTLSAPPGLIVGVGNATAVVEFAKGRGWTIENAPNTTLTIDKLLARRFPVALIPDLSVQARPETDQARLERLEPAGMHVWFQAVFSKPFAANHPQFMRQFWLSLCQASRKEQPDLQRCTP